MHLLQALFLEVGVEHIQTIREKDYIRKTWTSLSRFSQCFRLTFRFTVWFSMVQIMVLGTSAPI